MTKEKFNTIINGIENNDPCYSYLDINILFKADPGDKIYIITQKDQTEYVKKNIDAIRDGVINIIGNIGQMKSLKRTRDKFVFDRQKDKYNDAINACISHNKKHFSDLDYLLSPFYIIIDNVEGDIVCSIKSDISSDMKNDVNLRYIQEEVENNEKTYNRF